MTRPRDTLRLRDLRFFAILGDLPHEREHRQPVEIDLEVTTDAGRPAATDAIADALDYRRLYDAVAGEVESPAEGAPHLVETLCERIAARVLSIDGVSLVRVRCRKPWASLPGPATVEIEIERP